MIGYGIDDQGSACRSDEFFLIISRLALGSTVPVGTKTFFLRVKQLLHEAAHSSSLEQEFRVCWACFHEMMLRHGDNFTFTATATAATIITVEVAVWWGYDSAAVANDDNDLFLHSIFLPVMAITRLNFLRIRSLQKHPVPLDSQFTILFIKTYSPD